MVVDSDLINVDYNAGKILIFVTPTKVP